MRTMNFPLTSTALPHVNIFRAGQAQLCAELSLMLESIISQLLGRLTDVCCTNKGFQLERRGKFICLVAIYREVGLLISFKLALNEAIIGTQAFSFIFQEKRIEFIIRRSYLKASCLPNDSGNYLSLHISELQKESWKYVSVKPARNVCVWHLT